MLQRIKNVAWWWRKQNISKHTFKYDELCLNGQLVKWPFPPLSYFVGYRQPSKRSLACELLFMQCVIFEENKNYHGISTLYTMHKMLHRHTNVIRHWIEEEVNGFKQGIYYSMGQWSICLTESKRFETRHCVYFLH